MYFESQKDYKNIWFTFKKHEYILIYFKKANKIKLWRILIKLFSDHYNYVIDGGGEGGWRTMGKDQTLYGDSAS